MSWTKVGDAANTWTEQYHDLDVPYTMALTVGSSMTVTREQMALLNAGAVAAKVTLSLKVDFWTKQG